MKKPAIEVFEKGLKTVEELICTLMEVPKGYAIQPEVQECKVAIDHYDRCIIIDKSDSIWESISYFLDDDDTTKTIDVPRDKLEQYKQEVYGVIGYSDLCSNGNYEPRLIGIFSNDLLAIRQGDDSLANGSIHHYEIEKHIIDEYL
jgi:hypothetical protein